MRHLVLHSDCCPGQIQNSIVACMLLEVIKQTSIQVVDLKFLEPCHTHMECDSMHATIERASEYMKIFWLNDWINVLRLANKKNPYKVNVMDHNDFLNYKGLKDKIMLNTNKDYEGNVVDWKDVKWLRFEKDKPNTFQYKTSPILEEPVIPLTMMIENNIDGMEIDNVDKIEVQFSDIHSLSGEIDEHIVKPQEMKMFQI